MCVGWMAYYRKSVPEIDGALVLLEAKHVNCQHRVLCDCVDFSDNLDHLKSAGSSCQVEAFVRRGEFGLVVGAR